MVRNCKAFAELISQFVDGALPAGRAWEVQMHLSVCPECAKLAAELSQTVSLLSCAEPLSVSTGFDARLRERLALVDVRRQNAFVRWFKRLAFWPMNGLRLPSLKWAFVQVAVVCTFLMIAIFLIPQLDRSVAPIDAGYNAPLGVFVETCVQNHKSFLSTEPLADPAAQMLANQMDGSDVEDTPASTATTPRNEDPSEIDKALVGEDL